MAAVAAEEGVPPSDGTVAARLVGAAANGDALGLSATVRTELVAVVCALTAVAEAAVVVRAVLAAAVAAHLLVCLLA